MSENVEAPSYWTNETSGVLRSAVQAYLFRQPMTPENIGAMRAYLRQWMRGDWRGPGVQELRDLVDAIETSGDITVWLNLALKRGIDPL